MGFWARNLFLTDITQCSVPPTYSPYQYLTSRMKTYEYFLLPNIEGCFRESCVSFLNSRLTSDAGRSFIFEFSTCSGDSFDKCSRLLAPMVSLRYQLAKRSYGQLRLDSITEESLGSLKDVLACFGSDYFPLVIMNNITKHYSEALRKRINDLENDTDIRKQVFKSVGPLGWHHERLLAAWELALLENGFISRWAILYEN